MRRVVVDTDTGVDDALALMLLAADPEVEILAVISVFGNTTGSAPQTMRGTCWTPAGAPMCRCTAVPTCRSCRSCA